MLPAVTAAQLNQQRSKELSLVRPHRLTETPSLA